MIRTLIVDDEPLVRKGLISVMPWRKYGFCVVGEASSGEKALEFLRRDAVDLVFVDLAMPGLPGLALMARIREEFPGVSFAVLTCHMDFEAVQQALRLGAVDYLVKMQLEKECMDGVLERIARRVAPPPASTEGTADAPDPLAGRFSEEIRASIANAVKYLRECPLGEASQDAVARRVNMSRGYFSHCFKEVMGVSFAEFLRDLRVERSRQLLAAHPTRPVYWVAEKMGFRDEKYFSRFFKEHTGMLPTEYRRQQRPQHTNPKP